MTAIGSNLARRTAPAPARRPAARVLAFPQPSSAAPAAWSLPQAARGATARLACRPLGRRPRWILEFPPTQAPEIDPLMGWTGSADPQASVTLTFPSEASALAFASRQGWPVERAGRLLPRCPRSAPSLSPLDFQLLEFETGERQAEPSDPVSDPVELAALESFPASDPPAWIWSPRGAGRKKGRPEGRPRRPPSRTSTWIERES